MPAPLLHLDNDFAARAKRRICARFRCEFKGPLPAWRWGWVLSGFAHAPAGESG